MPRRVRISRIWATGRPGAAASGLQPAFPQVGVMLQEGLPAAADKVLRRGGDVNQVLNCSTCSGWGVETMGLPVARYS